MGSNRMHATLTADQQVHCMSTAQLAAGEHIVPNTSTQELHYIHLTKSDTIHHMLQRVCTVGSVGQEVVPLCQAGLSKTSPSPDCSSCAIRIRRKA